MIARRPFTLLKLTLGSLMLCSLFLTVHLLIFFKWTDYSSNETLKYNGQFRQRSVQNQSLCLTNVEENARENNNNNNKQSTAIASTLLVGPLSGRPNAHALDPEHYDVVINSYMRGGSTLTGMVLGHRSDSFYVYEPLMKIARWSYWRGNNTICRSDRIECQKVSPDDNPDPKFMFNKNRSNTGSLILAQSMLNNIYDCKFQDFERLVLDKEMTIKASGPSWSSAKFCIDRGGQQASCIDKKIPNICKNASHRVTKVLRLTVDNLEPLLQSKGNLKIIHLFRDPRAIINSRIETEWYPTFNTTTILSNAASLCKRMMYDFREGQQLLLKYPTRFKFLYYEDLNNKPLDKVKTLYKYLRMSLDESKYAVVKKIRVLNVAKVAVKTERERNTAFWWRKKMDWDIVKEIDTLCGDVYTALGYVPFSRHQELRNLNIKSVHIPSAFALL